MLLLKVMEWALLFKIIFGGVIIALANKFITTPSIVSSSDYFKYKQLLKATFKSSWKAISFEIYPMK